MSPSIDTRENRELAGEMKFMVTPEAGEQVRQWARICLAPDPHAAGADGDEYRITSLYFDTARFDVFRREGSYGRSKFRIRRYGAGGQVFLERKLKTRGLVSKRRTLVPMDQLERLGEGGGAARWAGFWFDRRLRLRQLRPVCQISYGRTARVTMTAHGPVRLTIDQNLLARPIDAIGFGESGGLAIAPEFWIVEMKFRAEMPALFRAAVQEFALVAAPVSKYRLSVARLGLAPAELLDSAPAPVKTPAYA